jgi:hypothetical protein
MRMEKYLAKLRWSAFLVTSAGLMLALASMSPAYATPPTSGSGTFTITSYVITSTTYAGGNTIYTATGTSMNTGAFAGPFSATFRDVVHADGSSSETASGTFTGTVGGSASGTATCISPANSEPLNTIGGIFVCEHGTGGLAGLHAVYSIPNQPASNPTFTYTLQYHFDP